MTFRTVAVYLILRYFKAYSISFSVKNVSLWGIKGLRVSFAPPELGAQIACEASFPSIGILTLKCIPCSAKLLLAL